MNDDHPSGRSKSDFFRRFGFTRDDWPALRDALLAHPSKAQHTDTDSESEYGEKRTFECQIDTPDDRNPCIRTVWQQTGDRWRLITAYPFL